MPSRFPSPPLLVAGPTASGKSAYAMKRAAETPSVIVNADSMQVYRDLRVITARPTEDEEATVPHRLFGHVDGALAYSTGRYARDLGALLDEVAEAGLRPIIVGGTGLYFRAILEGLSPVPEIAPEVRARWRALQAVMPAGELHQVLADRDPAMAARLQPSDPQRIVRALEVLESTGRSLADWQEQPGVPLLDAEACERVVISPPKPDLFARAEARFDRMLTAGALSEVTHLAARELDPTMPVMRALGVCELMAHLTGKLDLADAADQAKAATRAYIKRQRTWIMRNMQSWKEVSE